MNCVGIDLGTTCSSVAYMKDGTPTLVKIDGSELLPSVIWYGPEGTLVGQEALNSLALDPDRGILSSKRQMGTPHRWSIDGAQISPVDAATTLLKRLVEAVEQETGERPDRAVITVPAWFTNVQRAETRAAGQAAGLTIERLINEPTAAALAHGQGFEGSRLSLVYDLGGGTFDVSLVRQNDQLTEVLASHGDTRLGGDDVDLALFERVLSKCPDHALAEAVRGSTAASMKLRLAVESVKRELGQSLQATLRVPYLVEIDGEARHLELPLDRADLDAAVLPLLHKTLSSVEQVLSDADVQPAQVNELLLVGGSTLLPQVWHLLFHHYGLEGSHGIPPRRAVVLGAAMQAAIIDGSPAHGVLVDVAPYALSMGVTDGYEFYCKVITPRNSPLPSRHTQRFHTCDAYAPQLDAPIFQGSARNPDHNSLLTEVKIKGLPRAPDGQPHRPISVTFEHDLDGTVSVTVVDVLAGIKGVAQVAVDGQKQEALWQTIRAHLVEDGLMAEQTSPQPQSLRGSAGSSPALDLDGAEQLFLATLEAGDLLPKQHVSELQGTATKGLQAIESQDLEMAAELYDSLSDALFEHGVYL